MYFVCYLYLRFVLRTTVESSNLANVESNRMSCMCVYIISCIRCSYIVIIVSACDCDDCEESFLSSEKYNKSSNFGSKSAKCLVLIPFHSLGCVS